MTYPTKKIGEVVELKYGKGLPRADRNANGKYPIYGANGILDYTDKYLIEGEAIIIGRKGSAGEITRVSGKFWPSDVTYFVLGNKQIDIDYLFYLFKSLNLQRFAVGVKPGINRNRIYELEIPLPSLAEQKKIVAKLERVLAKIGEAKKLRAEALENTDNLLSAELHKIFSQQDSYSLIRANKRIVQKWEEKELGEVLEKITGGGTPSKSNNSYWGGDIPWASVKDVKEDKYSLTKTEDFITKEGLENSSSKLIPSGSLIISTRMGLGRIVKTEIDVAINQDLKALFPKKELDNDFLLWFYVSKYSEVVASGTGATVSGIRLEYLRKIKIPLPPIDEQKKIVARLDSLSEKIEKIKNLQSQTAAYFKTLEQSVLSKAFSGNI